MERFTNSCSCPLMVEIPLLIRFVLVRNSTNPSRVSLLTLLLSMHATVHGRGQMVIPARARKEARIETGDVVNVLPEGDGRLVLVRMERPKPKPRNKVRIIRRKGKHSLLSIGRPISREEVFKALEQFPP